MVAMAVVVVGVVTVLCRCCRDVQSLCCAERLHDRARAESCATKQS
jgi:hypothetical protein